MASNTVTATTQKIKHKISSCQIYGNGTWHVAVWCYLPGDTEATRVAVYDSTDPDKDEALLIERIAKKITEPLD